MIAIASSPFTAQRGIDISSMLANGGSTESMALRVQSISPGQILPPTSRRVFEMPDLQKLSDHHRLRTVPMPPGATTKASDESTN
jgi:hypothetical protein